MVSMEAAVGTTTTLVDAGGDKLKMERLTQDSSLEILEVVVTVEERRDRLLEKMNLALDSLALRTFWEVEAPTVDVTVETITTSIHPTIILLTTTLTTTTNSNASATTTSPSETGMEMCMELVAGLTRLEELGATPMEDVLMARGLKDSQTTPGPIKPVTAMENN